MNFVQGLYGAAFTSESEAGFSSCVLWKSLGFAVAYSYSAFICTSVKAYILIGFMIVGTIGFIVTDYSVKKSKVTMASIEVKVNDSQSRTDLNVL